MNQLLFSILICFLAGAGAGLGTGFAGLSAATVISPMLIAFLDVPAYDAIGIALASDVLASAVSARTYAKNGSIDIKNGLAMMAGVLSMTVVGSWLSTYVDNNTLGNFSVVMALVLGLRFLLFPLTSPRQQTQTAAPARKALKGLAGGAVVGLICGFFGAGGGMMMLMVLTMVLGYELKTAVGTSVFVMTFSALTGAVSHFSLGDMPSLSLLFFCILFTLLWALPVEVSLYVIIFVILKVLSRFRYRKQALILITVAVSALQLGKSYLFPSAFFTVWGTNWFMALTLYPYFFWGALYAVTNIKSLCNIQVAFVIFLLSVGVRSNIYGIYEGMLIVILPYILISFGECAKPVFSRFFRNTDRT